MDTHDRPLEMRGCHQSRARSVHQSKKGRGRSLPLQREERPFKDAFRFVGNVMARQRDDDPDSSRFFMHI